MAFADAMAVAVPLGVAAAPGEREATPDAVAAAAAVDDRDADGDWVGAFEVDAEGVTVELGDGLDDGEIVEEGLADVDTEVDGVGVGDVVGVGDERARVAGSTAVTASTSATVSFMTTYDDVSLRLVGSSQKLRVLSAAETGLQRTRSGGVAGRRASNAGGTVMARSTPTMGRSAGTKKL